MSRVEAAVAIGALALLAGLAALAYDGLRSAVYGAEPTTCSFPPTLDTFQKVAPQDKWNAADHNRILCALNSLERRSKQGGVLETVCADVTVPASTRQLVSLGLASTVAGTETVFPTVRDTVNPSRLEADGWQGIGGTTVSIWVFNRDGTNARSGRACVGVLRP
jgi:hypothetical protein